MCWWYDRNGYGFKRKRDCVIWVKEVDTFPYVGGVGGIVMSWFLSPIFSGIIAMVLFAVTRASVLRKDFNSNRINIAYPILIGSTMTINAFFIIYKGAKGLGLHNTSLGIAFGSVFGIGGVSALITIPLVPKLKKYVESKFNKEENNEIEMIETNQIELNIQSEHELKRVQDLHDNAEKFDNRTESTFKYLQIFTAICDSFSHG